MQFKSTFALCAAVLSAVAEGRIAFTTLPSSVKAGSPVRLAWEGADGTPITITLKRGPSNDLQTVALVTGNASGNSYTWTPSTDLENGSDYALQITQDDTDINYTGLFTISGGTSSSGSSSSSSSSSSNSATSSSAAAASGSASVSANSTTTAAPSGTAPVSAGITGGSASRNTTLSRPTLSRTSSSATSSEEATTTSESSSETSSSTAAPTNAAVNIASNFGLLLAGMAAVVYLG